MIADEVSAFRTSEAGEVDDHGELLDRNRAAVIDPDIVPALSKKGFLRPGKASIKCVFFLALDGEKKIMDKGLADLAGIQSNRRT